MPNIRDYSSEIKNIIAKHLDLNQYQLFIFGSRADKTNQKFSDYDIGILGKAKIDTGIMAKITADLDESNLPVTVDVVDFNAASVGFKKVALKHIINL